MQSVNLTKIAGTIAGSVVALLLAFQTSAQGQSGGARPARPEVQAPSRLPQDKLFGEKGVDASAKKAAYASPATPASARRSSAAEADCAAAKAAIAAAGTGGTTGKGQGGEAGAAGRAKAAAAACSGIKPESAADAGRSDEAPGHTGATGVAQATSRADEHADDGLEKARSNEPTDAASDSRNSPAQSPPR